MMDSVCSPDGPPSAALMQKGRPLASMTLRIAEVEGEEGKEEERSHDIAVLQCWQHYIIAADMWRRNRNERQVIEWKGELEYFEGFTLRGSLVLLPKLIG